MASFSIVVPTFNSGEYIKDCILSVQNQAMPDFELLIVDGGSTETGFLEWIKSLNDTRIKFFYSDTRLTIEENWARIKEIPKREFFTILGHDDILFPDYLDTMKELIDRFPDASLYQTHFTFINVKGGLIQNSKPMKERLDFETFLELMLTNKINFTATGFLMRSDDYERVGGIPLYPYLLFSDNALWLSLTRISYLAVAGKTCFSFRIHENTSTVLLGTKHIEGLQYFVGHLAELKKTSQHVRDIILKNGGAHIISNCHAITHRLIHTNVKDRKGITVKGVIARCDMLGKALTEDDRFTVLSDNRIRMANNIDGFWLLRTLFYRFRQIYSKPILKGRD